MQISAVGAKEYTRKLDKLKRALTDLRPAFSDIGDISVKEYKANFPAKGDVLESSWPPRKRSYPWPILVKTGKMKANWKVKPTKGDVTVLNPTAYARYHHFGTPKLPIRKLVGVTSAMMRNIVDRIKKHIFSNL